MEDHGGWRKAELFLRWSKTSLQHQAEPKILSRRETCSCLESRDAFTCPVLGYNFTDETRINFYQKNGKRKYDKEKQTALDLNHATSFVRHGVGSVTHERDYPWKWQDAMLFTERLLSDQVHFSFDFNPTEGRKTNIQTEIWLQRISTKYFLF